MAAQPLSLAVVAQQLPPSTREAHFSGLVARYGPSLYRTALRQLGNPDDARDALQDALLLAYRHLDQFEGRSEISTWLTRIVINAARGQRRRTLAHPTSSLEEVVAAGRQFPDARLSPEARFALRERRQCLERLIERLSPPLRAAIQLYDLDGLPLRQAAQRLGIKASTFKCRVFRARGRLASLRADDSANAFVALAAKNL